MENIATHVSARNQAKQLESDEQGIKLQPHIYSQLVVKVGVEWWLQG